MENIPQKIYLQIGDDLSPAEIEELDFNDLSGVTWCTDKIHDTDIEFTISDVEGQIEQLCHCGKQEDSRYSPCCSLEHWHDKFS